MLIIEDKYKDNEIRKHFELRIHHPEKKDTLIVYGIIRQHKPIIYYVNDLSYDEYDRLKEKIIYIVTEEWKIVYPGYINL
jgi:hypothetical protein